MKTARKIIMSIWTAILLLSCQDSLEIYSVMNDDVPTSTRVDNSRETYDYYWFKGEKYYLKKVRNRSFILFDAKNESRLINSLSQAKINADITKIKDFKYGRTDSSENASKLFVNLKWLDINIDEKEANRFPEIVYAAPYYCSEEGREFPLTNMIYIVLNHPGDYSTLEKMAKDYNVGIIGKYESVPNLYMLSCTKESKGNALEIANILHESGSFNISEPVFISAGTSTADSLYVNQWYLKHNGQYGYSGFDINFETASIPSSSNIVVAVVDNGVELTHSDINLNSFSWDAVNQSSPSVVWPSIWGRHGTNVAGIISGIKNNTIGIAGITTDISVMSLSVDYTNSAVASHLAGAIRKAVDMGASVINNS